MVQIPRQKSLNNKRYSNKLIAKFSRKINNKSKIYEDVERLGKQFGLRDTFVFTETGLKTQIISVKMYPPCHPPCLVTFCFETFGCFDIAVTGTIPKLHFTKPHQFRIRLWNNILLEIESLKFLPIEQEFCLCFGFHFLLFSSLLISSRLVSPLLASSRLFLPLLVSSLLFSSRLVSPSPFSYLLLSPCFLFSLIFSSSLFSFHLSLELRVLSNYLSLVEYDTCVSPKSKWEDSVRLVFEIKLTEFNPRSSNPFLHHISCPFQFSNGVFLVFIYYTKCSITSKCRTTVSSNCRSLVYSKHKNRVVVIVSLKCMFLFDSKKFCGYIVH